MVKASLHQNQTLDFHASLLQMLGTEFTHLDSDTSLSNAVMNSLEGLQADGKELLIAEWSVNKGEHDTAFVTLREMLAKSQKTATYIDVANFVYDILVDTSGEGELGERVEEFYGEILREAEGLPDVFDASLCMMLFEHVDGGKEGMEIINMFIEGGGTADRELWVKYAVGDVDVLRRGVLSGVEGLKTVLLESLLLRDGDDDDSSNEIEMLVMGAVSDVERGVLMTQYYNARPTVETVKFGLKSVTGGEGLNVFCVAVLLDSTLQLDGKLRRKVWEYRVGNSGEEGGERNDVLTMWEEEEREKGEFNFAGTVGARRTVVA